MEIEMDEKQTDTEKREHWSGRCDFFLTNVGYTVGLSNIWRFPYLCYKNGGGAFLIPYIIFLVLGAIPMFFLEYSISQFSSKGPISVWKICPLMKGLGYSMNVATAIVTVYFNVMIAWVLYFLYQSFTSVLPWSTCNNQWNTIYCYISDQLNSTGTNVTFVNGTYQPQNLKTTASEEFFRNKVLQISSGIEDIGNIRLELVLCLVIFWSILFLCLCRGIKVSGKVVYITALFPYIVLLVFLVRGVTLPGAGEGIKYYLIPQWEKLLSTKVWGEAALQIFFSSAMGWGGLLTFGSYNKFHHKIYRDSLIISCINGGSSIFAGFVTFSVLGFMAQEKGVSVAEVATQGPGLVFITYPEAIVRLPVSPLWAVLFFLMLVAVGIDSQFGGLETIITSLMDEYPGILRRRKVLFTAGLCIVGCLLGIPFTLQGGMYILQIVDWYCSLFSVMIVCILECITVGWIYGADRMYKDIEMMLGYKPIRWWSICWKFITPGFLVLVLIFNMTQIKPVSYGTYQYPVWAIAVGWIIGMISVVPIPIHMVIAVWRSSGSLLQEMLLLQMAISTIYGSSVQIELKYMKTKEPKDGKRLIEIEKENQKDLTVTVQSAKDRIMQEGDPPIVNAVKNQNRKNIQRIIVLHKSKQQLKPSKDWGPANTIHRQQYFDSECLQELTECTRSPSLKQSANSSEKQTMIPHFS